MSDEDHNHGLEGTETREEIEQVKISTSQSQASSSHKEVVLNIRPEKLIPELVKLQKELYPTERERERQNIKVEIKKIPEIMKRIKKFDKYFKPEWTFGPIHYRHSLKLDIKRKLAALFISVNGSTTEDIFEDFEKNIDGIRPCFGEDIISDIGNEELMGLLFLDGCAMLGFILCYVNWRLKEVGISDVEAANIERDLLLLENQIPFRVLEVLIDSGKDQGKKELRDSVVTFVYLVCRGTLPGHSNEDLYENLEKYCFSPEINKNRKAVHLLDAFRKALLFNPSSFDLFGCLLTVGRGTFWILCSCGCLAISYFLRRFKPEPQYNIVSFFRRVKEFFFSVQELKAAGIKFKPSHSLKTVTFRSLFFFRPQLMLPTLIVDDSTASKLVNLVAYEMCLSESRPNKKPWVTSYVNLLDSLVDNEQDIKDLRAAGILRNTLSTDLLAAELINNVGTGCIAPTVDAYMDVKEKIDNHYRTTCVIWMAQFCSTHFNTPWTITALFAATAVLVLTAIQTCLLTNIASLTIKSRDSTKGQT
ncbi:hypothetical protein TIFTF001_033220 [Ficus carica]|uniref:Uncharacterized protein n=1 Tax=Ficus carica TaxID=3494 RepID=A0AA88J7L9_FICCA|nr:hypothetical protein TIFTF001_033220 [Ficus carica]